MHRYELSDPQWARIEPLLPHPTHHGKAGHPFNDHRPIVNGILWILHTGAPWRDLPERYGPWQTVFYRFNRWRRDGTWTRIVTSLLDELDDKGQIDHDLWCIDGTVIRASRAAAGAGKRRTAPPRLGGREAAQMQEPPDHALGRSRGGFGTKVHLVCDSHGIIAGDPRHGRAGAREQGVRADDGPAAVPPPPGPGPLAAAGWRGTRATATRASGAGAEGGGSRR